MLVLCVTVEFGQGRFQDVRRWCPPCRHAEAAPIEVQRGLRLRSRQGELARVARAAPGRVILSQKLNAPRDFSLRQPLDLELTRREQRGGAFGAGKLHCAWAVLPDRAQQPEWVIRRDLKLA